MAKYVYSFGRKKAEGSGKDRELLGGKGAGLAEMTRIGLPVPAGFTITTECCRFYHANRGQWPRGLEKQLREAVNKLERTCGKKLGDSENPLLVSVRSGAAQSMPGMMETILNLGLNDQSVQGFAGATGDRRVAMDAYRRLIMMYGSTARGIPRELFDRAFDRVKEERTRPRLNRRADEPVVDTDVNADELAELVERFKRIYQEHTGEPFPQDPHQQLRGAINAVFDSWMQDKAVAFRRVENMAGIKGTAVNVQQMVFGNMGEDSGTGVCFTRDPSSGENVFYGDLLMNAQGEDVVAGIRTPHPLAELDRLMPDVGLQLQAVRALLELHYRDMQDLEFTVERGKLYMLQCRTGKRSPTATFRIAVDQATKPMLSRAAVNRLVRAKYLPRQKAAQASKPIISKADAIRRITAHDIERLFHPVIDPSISREELARHRFARGINAVPGAAAGRVVLTAAEAEEQASRGEKVVLVRKETSPEDVAGMHAAQGVLTATGGKTSHAAVVARGWGKCCIVGCGELDISYERGTISVNGEVIRRGEPITLDGSDGTVYRGTLPLVAPTLPKEYYTLMKWCDAARKLKVRANADSGADAARAVDMGAEGIGLCRTEHMFFETEERRLAMQAMIVADDQQQRRTALDRLLPFQRADFEQIFEAMNGKPVTIRLIDPPLHEFLPRTAEQVQRLSQASGLSVEQIENRREQLAEANPMLGHRGCRLCISYPEILQMQVRAIAEAAVNCRRRGIKVLPEIMIPLTIDAKELEILVGWTREAVNRVFKESGVKLPYLVGTMVETPRAALLADQLARSAEFISMGTNDLTQTTMALSRDDAGRFLPDYVDRSKMGIFEHDPFQSIDQAGVGLLVRTAKEMGRLTRPGLKVGVCGEHGGDPASIVFFHRVGLDYVSCSPFRVPVARLAAAQAALAPTGGRTRKPSAKAEASVSRTARRTTARRKPSPKKKHIRSKKATAKKASTHPRKAKRPRTALRR
jgi:pyruvate,orthophosphate dikinase